MARSWPLRLRSLHADFCAGERVIVKTFFPRYLDAESNFWRLSTTLIGDFPTFIWENPQIPLDKVKWKLLGRVSGNIIWGEAKMKRKRSMSKAGYFLAGIVTGLVTAGLFRLLSGWFFSWRTERWWLLRHDPVVGTKRTWSGSFRTSWVMLVLG